MEIPEEGASEERPLHRPKHKRGERYERLGTLSIDEVVPFIGNKPKEFFGYLVNMDTPPLKCFKKHGTDCQVCGLEAAYFVLEYDPLSATHLTLVGIENHHEVLFTRDHIRPISMGGSKNSTKNLRTCCSICNQILGRILVAQCDLMKRLGLDVETEIKKAQVQRKKSLPKKKDRFRVTVPFGMPLGAYWPEEEGAKEGEDDRMEEEETDDRNDA